MSEEDTPEDEFRDLVRDFRRSLASLGSNLAYPAKVSASGPIASSVADADASSAVPASSCTEPATWRESLADIRADIGECRRCPLSQSRTSIVFGNGSENARLLFVGEAPGAEEDRLGLPFVGPSGELLDKMIVAMGFTRESVYVANVLKCRPPKNRDPKTEEIACCEGFLSRQIHSIGPEIIVTLGKPAAHLLLGTGASMTSLRGTWQEFQGIPLMPTFHPAYLLREPAKKREAWADLQQVMRRLS